MVRTKEEILQGMDEVEFFIRCRIDFKFFCERMLGMTEFGGIHQFQMEWFYLVNNNPRVLIEAPSGFSKCLPSTAKIKTQSGYKLIKDISYGDEVISLNEETKKLETNKVLAKQDNGTKPVYKITTRTGRELKCTANHPLLVASGWKSIEDGLHLGEKVAIPRKVWNWNEDNLSDAEIKILAYMIAEGSCTKNGIRFTTETPEIVEDFNGALKEYNGNELKYYSKYDYGVNGLIDLLKKYGLYGKIAPTKSIPKEIFKMSKEKISLFLNRLWDCDGTICLSADYPAIVYSTVSKQLAKDVQSLLLFFGINSKLAFYNNDSMGYYTVRIEERENILNFISEIGTFHKQDKIKEVKDHYKEIEKNTNCDVISGQYVRSILNSTPWELRKKGIRVDNNRDYSRAFLSRLSDIDENENLKKLSESDIYWDSIVSIDYVGDEQTWDLQIDGSHNFVVDDIITHNTEIIGVAYPLWRMMNEPNLKILLVSKTIRQAEGNILNRIKDYIEDNEFLKDYVPTGIDKMWNKEEIKLRNGCWVKNVPYSINIKGYRANLIICDEIDSYEQPEIFFTHVLSRVIPGGKIVGISTPEGPTKLIAKIRNKKGTNFVYKKYLAIVNCKDPEDLSTGESIWPERFSIAYMMTQRAEMGENSFQMNYMCFHGDQMIQTENGLRKIKEIEVGEKVLTHKGHYKKVIRKYERSERKLIKIKQFGTNEPIITTNEHPFLAIYSERKYDKKTKKLKRVYGNPMWVPAKNLTKNHRLLHPKVHPEDKPKGISKELSTIIGLYLSEGSIGSNDSTVNFDFNKLEKDLHALTLKYLEKVSKNKPKIVESRTVKRVYINDRKLVTFLLENFGRAKEKRIPSWIYNESKENIKALLKGYELGDGYIDKSKMRITTVVRDLMNGICNLSMIIGKIPTKQEHKNWFTGDFYIEGRKVNISRDRYVSNYSLENSNFQKSNDYGRYIAYGIRSIELFEEDIKVYNLEVEEDNTYCLQGCAVHNCNTKTEYSDAVFQVKTILDSFDNDISFDYSSNPKAQYIVSADFAISKGVDADYDAFCVLEKLDDTVTVKHIEIHKGWNRIQKVDRLEELVKMFPSQKTTKIIADNSNMGPILISDLRSKGLSVVPQSFTPAERKRLLIAFNNILEGGYFRIPRGGKNPKVVEYTDLLLEQAIGIKRKTSEAGNEIFQSTAAHDDILMSMAMGASELAKMKKITVLGMSKH